MKKYLILLLVLVVACSAPNEPLQMEDPIEPVDTDPTEIGVSRVIVDTVAPGAETTVKLFVNLDAGQTYYLFEEKVPMEFTVLDGEPDANNVLKHIVIQDATSTVIEYRVTAPTTPGTYTWSGEYAVDNMKDAAQIMGDTTIIVQ